MLDYIGNDSVRLDENVVEGQLRDIGALISNENVELAYKCGRDMTICTSKRVLFVDTKGISGKRSEFLSMRFSCIKAYQVETAGGIFDRDATFKLFTNISVERRCISTDVRKGQSDIMEVLWYFNNKLLGFDTLGAEYVPLASPGAGCSSPQLSSFLGDDMSQINAKVVNEQFHVSPPVLQSNETCEIAFKGRQDLVLFTTKRILFIDIQGWSSKKTIFTTVPYSSIKIFQVAAAMVL